MKTISIFILSIVFIIVAKDNIFIKVGIGPGYFIEKKSYYYPDHSFTDLKYFNEAYLNIDGSIGYRINNFIKPQIGVAANSLYSNSFDFLYYLGLINTLNFDTTKSIGIKIGLNQFYENKNKFKDYENIGLGIGLSPGIKISNYFNINFDLFYFIGKVSYSKAPLLDYQNYYEQAKCNYTFVTISILLLYNINL
jgi:hypothetical protein